MKNGRLITTLLGTLLLLSVLVGAGFMSIQSSTTKKAHAAPGEQQVISTCVDTKTGYYSLVVNNPTLPDYDRQCSNSYSPSGVTVEELGYTALASDADATPLYHLYYNNGKAIASLYTVNQAEKDFDLSHGWTLDPAFSLAVSVHKTYSAATNPVYLQTSTDPKFPDNRRFIVDYTRGSDAAYGGTASWATFGSPSAYWYAAKTPA